jgi:hypothetical protein
LSFAEALDFVCKRHSLAQPNRGFERQLHFLDSPFYQMVQSNVDVQFSYWMQSAEATPFRIDGQQVAPLPTQQQQQQRLELESLLSQEQRAHEETAEQLRQVQQELEFSKSQIRELVSHTEAYIVASTNDRQRRSEIEEEEMKREEEEQNEDDEKEDDNKQRFQEVCRYNIVLRLLSNHLQSCISIGSCHTHSFP